MIFKPQLWKRVLHDPELGDVEQFIRHTEDGQWRAWEVYPDGLISQEVEFRTTIIPLGYHEVTEQAA